MNMRILSASLSASLVLSLLAACSGGSESDDAGGQAAASSTPGIHLPTSGGSSGGGSGSGGPNDCKPTTDGSACIGESYEGESVPLDIYIMFDQSGSMCSCVDPAGGMLCPDPDCRQTRLDAIRAATESFLRDPKSAGIGVGVGYFGTQPIGQAICKAAAYEDAAVTIGSLPAHADAIMRSLNAVEPTGETPTGAAIRGACGYAQSWKASKPGREVVILLLTDGKPEAPRTCSNGTSACCPTLDDAVTAAAECHADAAGIRTYVLGVGPLLKNLEEIAVAGGTERAYLVEGGNVAGEVLSALNRIRGDAAIPCELKLPPAPPGRTLDYNQVNIKYADSECNSSLFYYVETRAACGSEGGWYYDDPSNPQKIELCPTSCDRVSAPGGRLYYTVGCATQVIVR